MLNETEKVYSDLLNRIADALEGIRFNLASNLSAITQENNALRSSNRALNDTIQRIQDPRVPAPEFHPRTALGLFPPTARQVLSETENGVEVAKITPEIQDELRSRIDSGWAQPTLSEHKQRIIDSSMDYIESEHKHINEPDHNS